MLPRPFFSPALRIHSFPLPRASFCTRLASTSSSFCPYETLDLPRTATTPQIKKAYYKKVFDLHPDRNVASSPSTSRSTRRSKQDTRQNEQFLKVVKAYEILTDEKRRREWDSGLRSGFTDESPSPRYTHTRPYARTYNDPHNPFSFHSSTYNYTNPDPFDTYYHNVSTHTGPIYMSNGKMALLILTAAFLSSTVVYLHVQRVQTMVRERLDERDRDLWEFYEGRVRKAKENGFERQTEGLRRRAEIMERAEREGVELESPVGREMRRTRAWERDEVSDYGTG